MKIKPAIPLHEKVGKQVKLHMGPKGEGFISLKVLNESDKLVEDVEFLIDTGFNGFLQLNQPILDKLKLNIVDKSKTKAFNGTEVEVGITKTKVKLLDFEIFNFPIQIVPIGPCLIGTSLLKVMRMAMVFNWDSGFIGFTQDKKAKKRLRKSFS